MAWMHHLCICIYSITNVMPSSSRLECAVIVFLLIVSYKSFLKTAHHTEEKNVLQVRS